MPGLSSSTVRRLIALTVGAIVVVGIVRAVSSARGEADDLRAPDRAAVDALAGVAAKPESLAALRSFGVADTLFGRSGRLRFRTLTRVSAIALPGFISTYGENAIRTPAVHH